MNNITDFNQKRQQAKQQHADYYFDLLMNDETSDDDMHNIKLALIRLIMGKVTSKYTVNEIRRMAGINYE